jgi:two-component system, OmpR family, KDP operon response regulator KdpE
VSERGPRVLVVDDEQSIQLFLRTTLTAQGCSVHDAGTGQEALQAVQSFRPDVILLDLGLPDMDGFEVARRMRQWTPTPIIVVSIRDEESEKINALDAGADDYLSKPFGSGELSARIRAVLRRASRQESSVLRVGDLTVDLFRREVRAGGLEVRLTATEYELLKALIQDPGRVFTHRELARKVWGGSLYEDVVHLLRVNVSNLRRKLESDPARPRYIVTEPSVGYRLHSDSSDPNAR